MPHLHEHDRHSHQGSHQRRLAAALGLTALYFVVEVIGGLWSQSLALLADAGHMLTDVASLALALFAAWLAEERASRHGTFGYHRAEILAALVNGAALLAACVWIIIEAIRRFQEPGVVAAPVMLAVAGGGLIVNLLVMKILHGTHESNLNVRGAWLHVLADLFGSVAAIAGGILIWAFGWHWADPAASLLIALLVLGSAWRLLAEATSVLMEFAPRGIDVDDVHHAIAGTPGVTGLHDLHVWSISSGRVCLSVHVTGDEALPRETVLGKLSDMLRDRFGITHTTIQIEPAEFDACTSRHCTEQ